MPAARYMIWHYKLYIQPDRSKYKLPTETNNKTKSLIIQFGDIETRRHESIQIFEDPSEF